MPESKAEISRKGCAYERIILYCDECELIKDSESCRNYRITHMLDRVTILRKVEKGFPDSN